MLDQYCCQIIIIIWPNVAPILPSTREQALELGPREPRKDLVRENQIENKKEPERSRATARLPLHSYIAATISLEPYNSKLILNT